MHEFQDGEEIRVLKHDIEVELVVFRQSGEHVYVFDKQNRPYLFHVRELLPGKTPLHRHHSARHIDDRRA